MWFPFSTDTSKTEPTFKAQGTFGRTGKQDRKSPKTRKSSESQCLLYMGGSCTLGILTMSSSKQGIHNDRIH